METFERFHLQILRDRIENDPIRFIQVVYGPRQVGKTTLVRQLLDQTELQWH